MLPAQFRASIKMLATGDFIDAVLFLAYEYMMTLKQEVNKVRSHRKRG
ncbi:hypothetical protein POKO110462_20885 [Pontibacter korlensis]